MSCLAINRYDRVAPSRHLIEYAYDPRVKYVSERERTDIREIPQSGMREQTIQIMRINMNQLLSVL